LIRKCSIEDFVLFKRAATGVPAGAYEGEFIGVEKAPENPANDFGPGLKWSWRITKGDHMGLVAMRTTGTSPTSKNACGKIIDAIAGKAIAEGEGFNPQAFCWKEIHGRRSGRSVRRNTS
jgi:hypothetical protein